MKRIISYLIVVDYDMYNKSIWDAIKHYYRVERVSDYITSYFSTNREGRVKITIDIIHFNLNYFISSKEALEKLDSMGYRPAELCELLAFDTNYLDTGELSIVAFGTIWDSPVHGRIVSNLEKFLIFDEANECNLWRRILDLRRMDSRWPKEQRFAAIPK